MTRVQSNDAAAADLPGRPLRAALGISVAAWALIGAAHFHDAFAQSAGAFVPREEAPEDFPDRPGREETFYFCTACHGFKLVAQQGQTRRQWDDTLNFMTEKQNMPKLEGEDRELILDYLEASFPPQAPAAHGWQNPFLK